ncbi:hypothetical protein [Methanospirillum lacunae]|uniref:Uncharacterized protein n=1 Tax=Methanospirillum lacunae TaxID=668570 RepID=A0A2V2MZD2_9EURY|nr:hypothetical protein DK846_07735 [Methanospirillum lacunae]
MNPYGQWIYFDHKKEQDKRDHSIKSHITPLKNQVLVVMPTIWDEEGNSLYEDNPIKELPKPLLLFKITISCSGEPNRKYRNEE